MHFPFWRDEPECEAACGQNTAGDEKDRRQVRCPCGIAEGNLGGGVRADLVRRAARITLLSHRLKPEKTSDADTHNADPRGHKSDRSERAVRGRRRLTG